MEKKLQTNMLLYSNGSPVFGVESFTWAVVPPALPPVVPVGVVTVCCVPGVGAGVTSGIFVVVVVGVVTVGVPTVDVVVPVVAEELPVDELPLLVEPPDDEPPEELLPPEEPPDELFPPEEPPPDGLSVVIKLPSNTNAYSEKCFG